ncbi:MAG: TonB-dependent receptor plug domain-containing protein [Bacteroidota bacterium]
MKSLRFFFLFSVALLLGAACSPSKKAGSDASNQSTVKQSSGNTQGYQTLADYLRRYPSVRISGSGSDLTVSIRSSDTMVGNTEPLFVIDRNTTANTYSQASRLVDVNDIQSVRVLNGVEGQAEYGMRGANGVVVIKTKSGK